MKFTILSIILLLTVVFVACNKKAAEQTVETATTEVPAVATPAPPPVVEPQPETPIESTKSNQEIYVMVKFKKTPCYGKCAMYDVQLFNNGRVVYNGKKFVARVGVYEAKISEANVKMVKQKFFDVEFLDMAGEYPIDGQKIADLPSTIIDFRVGDMIKQVHDKHGAPEKLKAFEIWLADYFDGLAWVKIAQKD
ncbi:MAG: hypothetical protein ACI9XO_004263 [Paraglaciecola sp.]|jgi:hypothetical protein